MPRVTELVIHIVDDERIVRDSLATVFKGLGYDIRTYSGADEFLDNVRYDGPGCMLLDLVMRGKGGLQLLSELSVRGIDIPVIAMTGHSDVPVAVKAMRLGAVNFIEKPFGRQAIVDAVNACIDRAKEIWARRQLRESFQARLNALTDREREILNLMVDGKSSKAIGLELGISYRTVEAHRRNIQGKFGISSVFELARQFHEAIPDGDGPAGARSPV